MEPRSASGESRAAHQAGSGRKQTHCCEKPSLLDMEKRPTRQSTFRRTPCRARWLQGDDVQLALRNGQRRTQRLAVLQAPRGRAHQPLPRCVRAARDLGKFRVRATGQDLFFSNTQLDHVGVNARAQGTRLPCRRMEEIAKTAPLFLVGDVNTYRHDADVYSYLTIDAEGPQLFEAWLESEEKIGEVACTYHGFEGVGCEEERGAEVAANHIDWIFCRPQMKVLSTEVITEARDGRYPSDHYPIQSESLFLSTADLPPPSSSF